MVKKNNFGNISFSEKALNHYTSSPKGCHINQFD